MSPVASAARTSDSGTPFPRFTRSSKGLFASRGASGSVWLSGMTASAVEGPIDDVHLLLAREADEVDRVPGHADGQARVFFRVVHGIDQHLAVQHVDIHVVARAAEERVEHRRQVSDAVLLDPAES